MLPYQKIHHLVNKRYNAQYFKNNKFLWIHDIKFALLQHIKLELFYKNIFITEDWYPEGKQNIQAGHLKEALVPSLNPWTVYHLRMFAENQLGKSKEGKVLQVKTFNVNKKSGKYSVSRHHYILNKPLRKCTPLYNLE